MLEETPAPGLTDATRTRLYDAAILLGKAVDYVSAGTVEFLYDDDSGEFFFLEVNTRLQVEHGVTEQVSGIDLVEWMILQAAGELPSLASIEVQLRGSSIEARIYAEDPARNFQPTPGKLTLVTFPTPDLAHTETWIESGSTITPFYDPMIAKIIVTGKDRAEALARLDAALAATHIDGTETNLHYLRQVARSPEFRAGTVTTAFLGGFTFPRNAIEILVGGTQTTIQDYPGRVGFWNVGKTCAPKSSKASSTLRPASGRSIFITTAASCRESAWWDTLAELDKGMPELTDITVPSRIVYLPLSWDDPQAKLAQQKYMQAVRPDAPWCPLNIEFIRRINGLASVDEVYRIVHEASYLVLGLGDVYLGAPVATPIDPRHRLVTTKYNPARTWTPENAVGIGGAYLCVYGMEEPGGYQLVGRTIQVWNAWKTPLHSLPGHPWSVRFFDQIRFSLSRPRSSLKPGRASPTASTSFV